MAAGVVDRLMSFEDLFDAVMDDEYATTVGFLSGLAGLGSAWGTTWSRTALAISEGPFLPTPTLRNARG